MADLDKMKYKLEELNLKLELAEAYRKLATYDIDTVKKGIDMERKLLQAQTSRPVNTLEKVGIKESKNNIPIDDYYERARRDRPYFCYFKDSTDVNVLEGRIDFMHATVTWWDSNTKRILQNDGGKEGSSLMKALNKAHDNFIANGKRNVYQCNCDSDRRKQTIPVQKAAKYLTYTYVLFGHSKSLEAPVTTEELEDALVNTALIMARTRQMHTFEYGIRVNGEKKKYLRISPHFLVNIQDILAEYIGNKRKAENRPMSFPAQNGYSIPSICKELSNWRTICVHDIATYTWSVTPLINGSPVINPDTDEGITFPIADGRFYSSEKEALAAARGYRAYMSQLGSAFDGAAYARIDIYTTQSNCRGKIIKTDMVSLPTTVKPLILDKLLPVPEDKEEF